MINETKQIVEKKNIVLENKLHNRFDIEVRDARTGEVRQKARAFNVILDQFWTRLFANQSVYDYIQYGSGQGTPSASDTALFNWVGGANASAAVYDDAHFTEGWNSFTRSIVLDERTAVGVTLTEVGIAGATNSALCTHAMLQDMNGNPISIQKTNTDIITIYATVYIHWDITGSNGVYYLQNSHWFGQYKGSSTLWTGNGLGCSVTRQYAPVNPVANLANKSWTWGTWRLAVGDWNNLAIGHIFVADGTFDVDVKNNYQITNEVVGTGDGQTVEFPLLFDDANDLFVYVDGVLQNNVTIQYVVDTTRAYYFLDIYDVQSTSTAKIPAYRIPFNPYANSGSYIAENKFNSNPSIPLYLTTPGGESVKTMILSFSNDLSTWVELGRTGGGEIPIAWRSYRYIKAVVELGIGLTPVFTTAHNRIVFPTPPPAGAVITANYKTPFVPKDSNHVYDFSLTIQLGEYTNP